MQTSKLDLDADKALLLNGQSLREDYPLKINPINAEKIKKSGDSPAKKSNNSSILGIGENPSKANNNVHHSSGNIGPTDFLHPLDEEQKRTIIIRNLPFSLNASEITKEINALFSEFGEISRINVPPPKEDQLAKRESKILDHAGYAFVRFLDPNSPRLVR